MQYATIIPASFIGDVNLPPITLKPTNPGELESIWSMFATGKVPGYDNINISMSPGYDNI